MSVARGGLAKAREGPIQVTQADDVLVSNMRVAKYFHRLDGQPHIWASRPSAIVTSPYSIGTASDVRSLILFSLGKGALHRRVPARREIDAELLQIRLRYRLADPAAAIKRHSVPEAAFAFQMLA